MNTLRHLLSFILPVTVAGIIPAFQIIQFDPFGIKISLPFPWLQLPLGTLFFGLGLALLVATIRLFARIGQGTLAPWDPTRRLVTQGPYAYVRNPMISGVCFLLVGEALLCGSGAIGIWALIVFSINTVYFKLFEETGLVQRFGQAYLTYRAHVPMWLPRIKAWRADR